MSVPKAAGHHHLATPEALYQGLPPGTREADAVIAQQAEERAANLARLAGGPTTMHVTRAVRDALTRHYAAASPQRSMPTYALGDSGAQIRARLQPAVALNAGHVVTLSVLPTPVKGVTDLPHAWRDRADELGDPAVAIFLRRCADDLEHWLGAEARRKQAEGDKIVEVLFGRIAELRMKNPELPKDLEVTAAEFVRLQEFAAHVGDQRFLDGHVLISPYGRFALTVL